jgi:cobalt-zinc-cadmium efflux system membrane fusion protein
MSFRNASLSRLDFRVQAWRFAVAALTLIAAAGCPGAPAEKKTPAPEAPPALEHRGDDLVIPEGSPLRGRLRIGKATIQNIETKLVVPASVESDPARTAKITPPLPGRIVRLDVHFGDTVAKGQPLLALDSPDLVSAQTDYLKAKSALAQAERTLARQRDLRAHGIGSEKELEQAETEEEVAKGELDRASVRLKLLGSDAGQLGKPLTVRSPVSGRVVDFAVAPGEYHNDQNAVLMTIADLSTVWVTANVQEKDVRRVQQGQDATAVFTAYPGEAFSGKVLFVGDLLDPDTRTIKVRVAFSNQGGRLKPGMFATVTFTSRALPEVVVETKALVLLGDKSYVFVEKSPWIFERHPVKTGQSQGPYTIITAGIEAGTNVVMENAVLLQ